MILNENPARNGYIWFRQGIWLFRKNIMLFISLIFTFFVINSLFSSIPFLGNIFGLVLMPSFILNFMSACQKTIEKQPCKFSIVFENFRKYPKNIVIRLLYLGIIYSIALTIAIFLIYLINQGTFKQLFLAYQNNMMNFYAISTNDILQIFLTAIILYIPILMLFWFSPMLLAWHDKPILKSLFFSFISCWKNKAALLFLCFLWLATFFLSSQFLLLILKLLSTSIPIQQIILFSFILILYTIFTCSIYATYRGCFGTQEEQKATE